MNGERRNKADQGYAANKKILGQHYTIITNVKLIRDN